MEIGQENLLLAFTLLTSHHVGHFLCFDREHRVLPYIRRLADFLKGRLVNIFGYTDHLVSTTTVQFCQIAPKRPWTMYFLIYFPIKFYSQKLGGWLDLIPCSNSFHYKVENLTSLCSVPSFVSFFSPISVIRESE